MGRLPVPQKRAIQLPVFLKKKNGQVPVSHRLFDGVSVSGNKSCLYGCDVPDTSIYQKDHWTGIPGSDSAILYLYVLDWISFRHKNSTSVFYLEWDQHRYQKN